MANDPKNAQFFISYARQDKPFALKLRRALAAAGRVAWLDVKNIAALALWRKEIAAAIDAADVFVFVISPDAVASAACREELKLALAAKKRLAPVVWRETDSKLVPAALRAPNWIFAAGTESAEALAKRLIDAADRDPDWIREHSRLLTRASEWRQHRREPSRLLAGQGLQAALHWLADSARRGDRPVSALQGEFIEASRKADAAAAARQHELYLKALARQLAAQSELTRGSAEYPVETAALLAVESLLRWPTVEGDRALRRSLALVPRPPLLTVDYQRATAALLAHDGSGVAILQGAALCWRELPSGLERWRVRLGSRGDQLQFGLEETTLVVGHGSAFQVRRCSDGALCGRCLLANAANLVAADSEGKAIAVARQNVAATGHIELFHLAGTKMSRSPAFAVDVDAEVAGLTVLDSGRLLVAVIGGPSPTRHTRVQAWDTETGSTRVLWRVYGRPNAAEFGSAGTWVALTATAFGAGRSNEVHVGTLARRLADADAEEQMPTLTHEVVVDALAADGPDRLIAWTERGRSLHVWDAGRARLVDRFRIADSAYCAALAADGHALVVAHRPPDALRAGGRVSLVDRDNQLHFSAPADDIVERVACDAAGHVVVASRRSLTVWDSDTASAVRQIVAAEFTSLAFSADASALLLQAPADGALVVPVDRARPVIHLRQDGSIWSAVFVGVNADQVVTVGNPSFGTTTIGDPHLRLWDMGRAARVCLRRRAALAPVALTLDGRLMATTAHDGTIQVRHIASGRSLLSLAPPAAVSELAFDAAGTHLAAVVKEARLHVWRLSDAAQTATLELSERRYLRDFDGAAALALLGWRDSYDGVSDLVRFVDGQKLIEAAQRLSVDFARGRCAFATDEQRFEVRELQGHRLLARAMHSNLTGLELAPDGAHVVSHGADASARVWQLADGAEIARLEHPDRVLSCCISPDSRFIATGCSDRVARLWTWRAADLVAEARRRIHRLLSAGEQASFLPDRETRHT